MRVEREDGDLWMLACDESVTYSLAEGHSTESPLIKMGKSMSLDNAVPGPLDFVVCE